MWGLSELKTVNLTLWVKKLISKSAMESFCSETQVIVGKHWNFLSKNSMKFPEF